MVQGLAAVLEPADLTVIVNTGDDFVHYGLNISPDLDTVCYTLAGMVDPIKGWGINHDTYAILDSLVKMGGPGWFSIGDSDLCTHLERTRRFTEGSTLTDITADFSKQWGIEYIVLPMTDDNVSTLVETEEFGLISFQEYFVKHKFEPRVKNLLYQGLESAKPTRNVIQSLEQCDAVVICPSNPFLSIDPIIKIQGISELINEKFVLCVSPIIQNKCIKGPLSKILVELGFSSDQESIINHYRKLLNLFVFDQKDIDTFSIDPSSGIMTYATDIYLPDLNSRSRLAKEVIGLLDKYVVKNELDQL